ncbi:MAG: DNA-binding protein WhiA [Clostridiales bacterium]|nr:DNA-binding protein WhiA [Clostridiales bacterium]
MTFSSSVREELAHIAVDKKCCALSELAALVRTCASIEIGHGHSLGLRFDTENPPTARRIFNIIKFLYSYYCEVAAKKMDKLRVGHAYMVRLSHTDEVRIILKDTGMMQDNENIYQMSKEIPSNLLNSTCCTKSFLRGCYLGCGSMSDPNKSYHLEFDVHNASLAKTIHSLLHGFELNAKITIRKTMHVVYIKEAENIIALFSLIGSHSSLLRMENIMILKSVRNNVNRAMNFENANSNKSVDAAQRQLRSIRKLENAGKLKNLTISLREAAELRMEHPESTLSELSEISGNITKSGINHRMRRIMEIAKKV